MPQRSYNTSEYRFGFNGQEKDDEVKGGGNSLEFKFRIYDSRLGKFLSVDPISKSYPWNSPFAFAENRVIDGIDLEGKEWRPYNASGSAVPPGSKNITHYVWEGYQYSEYYSPFGDGPHILQRAPTGTVSSAVVWGANNNSATFYYSDFANGCGDINSEQINARTQSQISDLHPDIRTNAKKMVLTAQNELDVELTITDAYRSIGEQNNLYAQGRTQTQLDRLGINATAQPRSAVVTNSYGGQSFHNFGLAFDVYRNQNGEPNLNDNDNGFWSSLGDIGNRFGFNWGGDFRTIRDRPHFEQTGGHTWQNLLNRVNSGNTIQNGGETYPRMQQGPLQQNGDF